ncbi:MAG: DUF3800 domain-containing protein [Planctomycetes bacterium]|nr:DUF3800 domain-containing protein [Planctomycetota bacterium]
MPVSFVVYIDESGDEGFKFTSGSSKWFVLSAVITRFPKDAETAHIVRSVRDLLNRTHRTPLHFRNLKHEHRVPYVDAIAKSNIRIVSVLVHKPSIQEPEKFAPRHQLYRYTTRYLLERVSWYCRDAIRKNDPGDGTAKVVFSNRAAMSYDDLRVYLRYLKNNTGVLGVTVDWDVINPDQIVAINHDERAGLQIADAVASSHFAAVEERLGFTEPRYAKMLCPCLYRHERRALGYGLKFWPRDTVVLRSDDSAIAEWLVEADKKK